jgi:hypothetical protein
MYVLGNRSLNSLNILQNGISDEGLKHLLDAVHEQDATAEHLPEGMVGLYRVIFANVLDNSPVKNLFQV